MVEKQRKNAAKAARANLNASKGPLSLYNEQYGSKAVFAVMCPHTKYWQSTISNVVDKIVNTYETDGVYIDQIAAAGPRVHVGINHTVILSGADITGSMVTNRC